MNQYREEARSVPPVGQGQTLPNVVLLHTYTVSHPILDQSLSLKKNPTNHNQDYKQPRKNKHIAMPDRKMNNKYDHSFFASEKHFVFISLFSLEILINQNC